MTKKDYELIARAVNESHMGLKSEGTSIKYTARLLAYYLARNDHKFDPAKFLNLCGF